MPSSSGSASQADTESVPQAAGALKQAKRTQQVQPSRSRTQSPALSNNNDSGSTPSSRTPSQYLFPRTAPQDLGEDAEHSDSPESGDCAQTATGSPQTVHYDLRPDAHSETVVWPKRTDRTVSISTAAREGQPSRRDQSGTLHSSNVARRKTSLYRTEFRQSPARVTSSITVETRRFMAPKSSSSVLEQSLAEIQHLHRQEIDRMLATMKARLKEHEEHKFVYEEQFEALRTENETLLRQVSTSASEISLLKTRLSSYEDSHPGPTSHGILDSTLTATIVAVAARIEQWRDELVRNRQITMSRTDLNRLLSDLSSTSSQVTKLQQDYNELFKDHGTVRHQLQMTLSLHAEKDATIASLTGEIAQLQKADSAKVQRITALRRDNERLRNSISISSSRVADLERSNGALLVELSSSRDELEAKESLITEMDAKIASLTTEVDHLKRSDAEKRAQVPCSHQEYERLQKDSSERIELQKRFEAQSNELESVRNKLQDRETLIEEREHTIASLVAEADTLKGAHLTMTGQLEAERRETEDLQQNLAVSRSQIADLQEYRKVQAEEVDSLGKDLQTKMALLAEKERTISSLTADLGQARRDNGVKEERIARHDTGPLREKHPVTRDDKADVQRGFDAQLMDFGNKFGLSRVFSKKSSGASSDSDIADYVARALEKEKQIEELRQDHVATSSRYNDLEKSHEALTNMVSTLRDELRVKTSQYGGAKETIDSLSTQTHQLKATVADNAEQLTTAVNQIRELETEITTYATRFTQLQSSYVTQSEELQATASSKEEKDHEIAILVVERDRLTSANASRAEQISSLQQDLSVSISQITELQDRCKELSDELTLVNDELQISVSSSEDKDRKLTVLTDEVAELSALNKKRLDARSSIPCVGAFLQWMSEGSVVADKPITNGDLDISQVEMQNVLAHNALLWARSGDWSSAYEAAGKSIDIRPSAIGYVTKALSQAGNGELDVAMRAFDLAFGTGNLTESTLLLLIKAIILFVAGKYDDAISRIRDLISVWRDEETVYCCIQVLAKIHLMQGDYGRAIESLQQSLSLASSCTGCLLETISIIFGWTFDDFQITMQRCHCEVLRAAGRAEEAAETLLKILNTFKEKHADVTEWATDLKTNCIDMLEKQGSGALGSGEYEKAIACYTVALSLDPSNPIGILLKRSEARALKGLWEDALIDADEVIKLDPASHQGYERKYVALHGAENYREAINALLHMFSIIEKSPDEEIRRLRDNYTAPREAINAIDTAIREIFHLCPLVLIDLRTGRLCDVHERVRIFKSEAPFKKLVSEAIITKLDCARIRQAVAEYFTWVMLSHTWEGKEPTFQDVNVVDSIWSLGHSPLNEKLRLFCATAREDGHRWAWSDTCCIDKGTSAILGQSLTSMYRWYEEAAETLVYLADVLSSAELGDLTKSRWMTRAWTLQELLASKVVRFYNREWKLYLNDTHHNHKDSPSIKHELAWAMGVAPETITSFQPDSLGVREKLRLASTRNATVEEDLAYSLIGIFSSNIRPQYGLGRTALSELLENIVARTGDVTVIAWTGKSSPYNSVLPESLTVYSQIPYSPPPMETDELDACVDQLRTGSVVQDALAFYQQVNRLPRADFRNRCLHLPCIVFYVMKVGVQELDSVQGNLYRAVVPFLGKVEFRTADAMPLSKPRRLALVHPWLRDLRDLLDEYVSDDEGEVGSDSGADDQPEAESDGEGAGSGTNASESDPSTPASPLHAEPSAPVDHYQQALRLIARLGRPFNALLLELQQNNQYRRVATQHEIIVSGVPYQTNPKDLRAKVLEVC